MKTTEDHIKDLENTRAARVGRLQELSQKCADEGRSFDAAEGEEFDTIEAEVGQLDSDLVRQRKMQQFNIQTAAPVDGGTQEKAAFSRGAPAVHTARRDKEDSFEGQSFTRMAIAKAVGKIEGVPAWEYASHRWGKSNPLLVENMKAAVPGSGSGSGENAAELVSADNRFTGDFIEYLDSHTVYDKLPLREVPANVSIKGQDGAATGYWVGESKGIPMSTADFSTVSLTPLKAAALSVLSNELLRDSSPSAERLVRDALVEAVSQRIDSTFLSATAASAGVSPAGILNGVTADTASGTDEAALLADIKTLYAGFLAANNATGLWYVTTPTLAKSISLMRNALDQKSFPTLTAMGGSLEGDQVVTGENVGTGDLILLKPSDIWRIGSGGIEISISEHATVEMATDPAGASDTPVAQALLSVPVNMFQTESTAIKIVRSLNFAKRRSTCVDFVGDGAYA